MKERPSPLQAINQKEFDLRRRVDEADRQAEAQIRAAGQEAQSIIEQAHRAGQAEAEALFQQGVGAARRQADAIVAAAYEEAAALRLRAKLRLTEVADRIVLLVLAGEEADRI
jgi:vacuolar-type H+-ATPase subunit H